MYLWKNNTELVHIELASGITNQFYYTHSIALQTPVLIQYKNSNNLFKVSIHEATWVISIEDFHLPAIVIT